MSFAKFETTSQAQQTGDVGVDSGNSQWYPTNYPLDEGQVSSPFIRSPLYACTRAVSVYGAIATSTILVRDQNGNIIGQATAGPTGEARIQTTRPLQAGEYVEAKQKIDGFESSWSGRRYVFEYQGEMPKPKIGREVWECGETVGTRGVLPHARLSLLKAGSSQKSVWPTDNYWAIHGHGATPNGTAGDTVRVQQTICPELERKRRVGPKSEPATVKDAPDPMPPLDQATTHVGADYIVTKDAEIGAVQKFYENGNYFAGLWWTSWPDMELRQPIDMKSSETYSATQSLCKTSSPTEVIKKPRSQLVERLYNNQPEILLPCAGSSYVRVRSHISVGRLVVEVNGTYAGQASAKDGTVIINLFGNQTLPAGSTVVVKHFLETGQSVSTSKQIPEQQNSFKQVAEIDSYASQDGGTVSGFVRESERGPKFVYRECCNTHDPSSPRTVDVVINRNGNPYSTVTLTERRPGYYVGRWDFFKPSYPTQDSTWPPPANYNYEAILINPPCSNQDKVGPEYFRVLTGNADTNDQTAPSYAEVTFEPAGQSESVDLNAGDKTLTVEPNETFAIDLAGYDRQGVEKIEYLVSGSGSLASPTVETAQATLPVPPELNLDTQVKELGALEEVNVSGQVTNFAGTTAQTGTLTLKGKHTKPEIDAIEPSWTYSDPTYNLPDIEGEHLYGTPTLETEVIFSMPSVGIQNVVQTVSGSTVNGAITDEELENVQIPSALKDHRGQVEVQVRTFESGKPNTAKTSNTESFRLGDRKTGFPAEAAHDDFIMEAAASHCRSNGANGQITDLTVTDDPGGGPTAAKAIFTYGPNSNTTHVTFNFWVQSETEGECTGSDAPVYECNESEQNIYDGGVYIGPDCRTALVLSNAPPVNDPSYFHTHARFFSRNGRVVGRKWDTGLQEPIQNGHQWAKNRYKALISDDGTIVTFLANASQAPITSGNPQATGIIADLYWPILTSNSSVKWNQDVGQCSATTNGCAYSNIDAGWSWPNTASEQIGLGIHYNSSHYTWETYDLY